MRITLVKPPEQSNLNFGTFSLAVLAAAVRDIADITILDLTHKKEEAVDMVLKMSPDLIGITTMGLASVAPSTRLVKALHDAEIPIIVGGHGATMTPQPLLEAGADAVVCGEGEVTFREVIEKGISPEIKGLAFLKNGQIVKTPPRPLIESLDTLKEPARDLAGPRPEGQGVALLETSRGCPHNCIFCEATRFYHNVWRARSPKIVVHDIQTLVERGAQVIHIVDDNFTANPKRALKICELLDKGSLPLFFFFSARSDDLLRIPELIPALARSHFLRAGIGIETLEPELALYIDKPITFEQHQKVFTSLRKAGIFTMGSFIMGLPSETEEMRARSVDLAVKVGVDAAQFVPFQPLPGTPVEKGSGEPELWAQEAAHEATLQFRRHPVVVSRLLETSRQMTVQGILARVNLVKRLEENVLDPRDAERISQELKEIDPHILSKGISQEN
ncbi:MAG: B12-binding domain-containing radical SAM protein [Theionarchaea archaeon]|nr:B12-binding domain-containing radical SAM protein [Theionarchaea archaeon]